MTGTLMAKSKAESQDEPEDELYEGPTGHANMARDLIDKALYIIARRKARKGRKIRLDQYLDPICRETIEAEYKSELKAEYDENANRKSK